MDPCIMYSKFAADKRIGFWTWQCFGQRPERQLPLERWLDASFLFACINVYRAGQLCGWTGNDRKTLYSNWSRDITRTGPIPRVSTRPALFQSMASPKSNFECCMSYIHTPTVVIVIPAHQNVSGIDENLVPGSSFSAKYASEENIRTPIAKNNISKPSSL